MVINTIIFLGIVVLLKGLVTLIEVSLSMTDSKKIKQIETEDKDRAESLLNIMDNTRRFMATTSIINVLLVMGSGVICSDNLTDVLIERFPIYGGDESLFMVEKTIVLLIIMFTVTFFMVLFGTVVPRKIARLKYESVLKIFGNPLIVLHWLLMPFSYLIHICSEIISKIFGFDDDIDITQEEIMNMIDAGEEDGAIDENEKEMISNIFEFDDKIAGDIATHRKDIVAIPIDMPKEEIIKLVVEEKYTRYPVYEDNIDNIIGILHIKDIMRMIVEKGQDRIDIKKIIMNPYCVPFSKKTDELFEEMQKDKVHMSIIIDEYGGTAGIVTMEDLIEEIMGNIFDEYDEEETPDIFQTDTVTYMIDGLTELDDISEKLGIQFPDDEYETISGFIIGQIGHIPGEEEHLEIEYGGYRFKIEKTEDKRITLVKATKIEEEKDKEE
ncbi:MAG: HlyC/CorC family transporter [Firmicutes bacterium]|nr:HlyC/CorC family transporter [Bacillota bacterium]